MKLLLQLVRQSPLLGVLLLSIFYIIGILGIVVFRVDDFLLLTPFNLLVSLAIILWFHPKWTRQTYIFLLITFLVGYLVEVAGVNTGVIFGEYAYGPVLGWKVWNTPLMIGVNWVMLIYASGMTVNLFFPKIAKMLRPFIGATIMVVLDVLIEPVAIYYDFWTWTAPEVPFRNYLAWYVISLFLLYLFHRIHENQTNKVASGLLALQFLFFAVLFLSF
ncbi:MAG: carotenoid biosynthesis protein [Bacteroidota bacterium]